MDSNKKIKASRYIVPFRFDNVICSLHVGEPIDIEKKVLNTWGCQMTSKCQWNYMFFDQHPDQRFSMNVFHTGSVNFFSTSRDINWICKMVAETLDIPCDVEKFKPKISNYVVEFDLKHTVDLDAMFYRDNIDDISKFTLDDIFRLNEMQFRTAMSKTSSMVRILDRQSLAALMEKPFIDRNISLNVFHSGIAVSCGILSYDDIKKVIKYIQDEFISRIIE